MDNCFEKQAETLLNSPLGAEIAKHEKELRNMAQTYDGLKVMSLLQSNEGVQSAISSGSTEALSSAMSAILQTEEGKRLAKQLSEMFK